MSDKDTKFTLDMEDVAIPEIHVNGEGKEMKPGSQPEHESLIDYSGAIPEYHPQKKE